MRQRDPINLRDPGRYRTEAARFREMAAASIDSAALRDSYLALAIEYERLAQILEKSGPSLSPNQPPAPHSA